MTTRPKRKRATAIIEYPQGILLAVMRSMAPSLPGGGIKPGETELQAVTREIWEETRLTVVTAQLLFQYTSLAHEHAVFWVEVSGEAQAVEEVDRLAYYRRDTPMRVSPETEEILRRFFRFRSDHPDRFPSDSGRLS